MNSKTKYPAPLDSTKWKCNWLDCAGGMGLAGSGKCSWNGDWWKKDCPNFQTNTEFEKSCTGPHDSRAAGRLGNNSGHAEKTVSKGHGYNGVPLGTDREHAEVQDSLKGLK